MRFLITFLIVCALLVSGCGKDNDSDNKPNKKTGTSTTSTNSDSDNETPDEKKPAENIVRLSATDFEQIMGDMGQGVLISRQIVVQLNGCSKQNDVRKCIEQTLGQNGVKFQDIYNRTQQVADRGQAQAPCIQRVRALAQQEKTLAQNYDTQATAALNKASSEDLQLAIKNVQEGWVKLVQSQSKPLADLCLTAKAQQEFIKKHPEFKQLFEGKAAAAPKK